MLFYIKILITTEPIEFSIKEGFILVPGWLKAILFSDLSFGRVSGYFVTLPTSYNTGPLDARGAVASLT